MRENQGWNTSYPFGDASERSEVYLSAIEQMIRPVPQCHQYDGVLVHFQDDAEREAARVIDCASC